MTRLHTLHQDHSYLVVGLGATGYSVACYLLERGYRCSVQDDREHPPYRQQLLARYPQVEVINQSVDKLCFKKFDCLVVSPGLSVRTDTMKKVSEYGVRIIGDIELFAEAVNRPVFAITGSNGKSTVTELLGKMIAADNKRVAVGGNFGVPALDLLQQDADFYVLELSSFQLETTSSLKPLAATVLNISEDHMDRYDDLEDYQQCKKTIYRHSLHNISNLDDDRTRCDERDILFSIRHSEADYSVIDSPLSMLAVKGEGWIKTSELRLKGRHNWANCLAAMALASLAQVSREAILSTLKSYTGLAHRSEWVAEIDGVNWINDSKATNPGATRAAIDGLDEPVILLAGGQGKGADMRTLCESLRQHVKLVLLFGEDAQNMQQQWQSCVQAEVVEDMQQAVVRAKDIAIAGDIVLLSPACASFDQFSGFEQRGKKFCQLVRAMA